MEDGGRRDRYHTLSCDTLMECSVVKAGGGETVDEVDERIAIEDWEPIASEIASRATKKILLMPESWPTGSGEPVYTDSTESVRKLLVAGGVPVETATPISSRTTLAENRAATWVGPTLLVSGLLVTQNPSAIALALNLVAGYVTQLFPVRWQQPGVSLSIVQTSVDGTKTRKVKYTGPASGLEGLASVLFEFARGEVKHGGGDGNHCGADPRDDRGSQ